MVPIIEAEMLSSHGRVCSQEAKLTGVSVAKFILIMRFDSALCVLDLNLLG